jgi:hypothetical protein
MSEWHKSKCKQARVIGRPMPPGFTAVAMECVGPDGKRTRVRYVPRRSERACDARWARLGARVGMVLA